MAIDDDTVTPAELPPIAEEASWVEHLPALVSEVLLQAKEDGTGVMNFQARVLDARTRHLKVLLEALKANGIVLKGHLEDEAALEAIPTENLAVGTAYFVDFALRLWDGLTWGSSGSLRGDRGISLLGIWPDDVSLPNPSLNAIGDAYIWKHDVHVLAPTQDGNVWEALGIRGAEGKSFYEVWQEIPGNEGKPISEFVTANKGDKGDPGDDAFEVWKKEPGNTDKTMADYLLAIKGLKGDPGKNLAVLGLVANESDLQDKEALDQAAWVVNATGNLWIYIAAQSAWVDLGKFRAKDGTNGKDGKNVVIKGAVETFALLPATPAEQECWAVRGENVVYMWITDVWVSLGKFKGQDGTNGTNGVSLIIKGAVATFAALPEAPEDQDIYSVTSENTIYGWINNAWVLLGTFKGDKGEPGKSSFELWLDDPENAGKTEADYWTAQKGPKGDNGKNLQINGSVADEEALRAIASPQDQDAYVVNDTHRLWVWSDAGGGWKDLGPFKGADGKSAYQNWLDLGNAGNEQAFNTSLKGKDGVSLILRGVVATFADLPANPEEQWMYSVQDQNSLYTFVSGAWLKMGVFKGTDGKDGKSIDIIKVLTDADSEIPPADDTTKGKAYIDLDKMIWVNITNKWEEAGRWNGPAGDEGKPGTPLKMRGVIANVSELPQVIDSEEGDAWQTHDDKMVYVLINGQWSAPYDFIGPTGKDGEEGPPGPSVPIKGDFPDMAALKAAHPTGVLGDGYLLSSTGTLAIWSSTLNDWKDVGTFRGPPGKEGPPGEGLPGKQGVQGIQGSRWLTLAAGVEIPSETFSGRVGDWAVSSTFNVFYKTADQGWVLWGRLVAGDVNSPLTTAGKVVRYGTTWVSLPVDEVPEMVAGKFYVRALVEGNAANKGEWIELKLPAEPPQDGKLYARQWNAGSGQLPKWMTFTPGISDISVPDTNFYLRKGDSTWSKYIAPTLGDLGGVSSSELGVSIATLVNGTIPAIQLPSYVDDVLEFDNFAALPTTGEKGKIYITDDNNTQYRWSGTAYVALVASPGTTDAVVEGSTNLYFTQSRVRATALTGLSLTASSAIVATDTVITAFGKLQAQITAFSPGIADVGVTDTNLYARKGDKTWQVFVPGISGPTGSALTDGKQYNMVNGVWTAMDRYDLAIQPISNNTTINPAVNLFALINNPASSGNKQITLADGPKGANARALVVVVKINGTGGTVTFVPSGTTVLVWNGGTAPSLSGSRTIISFVWDGVEWLGTVGSIVPA